MFRRRSHGLPPYLPGRRDTATTQTGLRTPGSSSRLVCRIIPYRIADSAPGGQELPSRSPHVSRNLPTSGWTCYSFNAVRNLRKWNGFPRRLFAPGLAAWLPPDFVGPMIDTAQSDQTIAHHPAKLRNLGPGRQTRSNIKAVNDLTLAGATSLGEPYPVSSPAAERHALVH